MTILTNTQAVAARTALSLSQTSVAKDVGINRTYLSQFESGARILEDRWQSSLLEYYQAQGWEPDSNQAPPQGQGNTVSIRMRDGFQISANLDDEQVEGLLTSYYDNQLQIEELARSELPRGSIFQSIAKERALKIAFKIFCLTAQQDNILRQLRGHDPVLHCNEMPYREMETVGQYAGSLIAEALGVKSIDDDESELSWLSPEAV